MSARRFFNVTCPKCGCTGAREVHVSGRLRIKHRPLVRCMGRTPATGEICGFVWRLDLEGTVLHG